MSEPLWSDARIFDAAHYWVTPEVARATAVAMRDEYEAALAALTAERDALREECERLKAERWEPIEDGEEIDVAHFDYATDFESLLTVDSGLELALFVNDEADTARTFLYLPDDMRLCRRVRLGSE